MLTFIILLLLAGFFAWASLHWGVDSRDNIDSAEWERRAKYAFAHRG